MDAVLDQPQSRARDEALVITDFGVDLAHSDLSSLEIISATFMDAVRTKNRSQWLIGDLYLYAVEQSGYGEEFAQVLDAANFSLRTAQNYAAVCSAWVYEWRRVPLSQSHYAACAALVRKQPTAALQLLEQAYDGKLGREWIREQCAFLLGGPSQTIEILLSWDNERQVFIPSQHLNLPAGTTRTIRLKQGA